MTTKNASETLRKQKEINEKGKEIRKARGGKTLDELIDRSSKKGEETSKR